MVEILPIRIGVRKGKFNLFESLQGFDYKENDVLVISSKFVSMSEGAVVNLGKIRVGKKARALAAKCQ